MASHPKTPSKTEYTNFHDALKKVLSVSHAELKSKLDAEKKRKAKASASHGATS